MKKLVITSAVISLLAIGGTAAAEQQLSLGQMDGITAGGSVDGLADARARGVTATTSTLTEGRSITIDELQIAGQVGKIDVVASNGRALSSAFATGGGFADGHGSAVGNTVGTLASDVVLTSYADADTTGALVPGSRISAYSYNQSVSAASEIVLGRTSTANSTAASVAVIGN